MRIILESIIKRKTIELIKSIGDGLNELVFDINLDIGLFNTIEYSKKNIILHIFKSDNYDICYDYDALSESDKLKILSYLRSCSTSR